jgi:hypothetical protein
VIASEDIGFVFGGGAIWFSGIEAGGIGATSLGKVKRFSIGSPLQQDCLA